MHRLIYVSGFSVRFPREREDQEYEINAIIRASDPQQPGGGAHGPRCSCTGAISCRRWKGPSEAVKRRL